MYKVYILRVPKNHLYIGVTSNLNGRISRHKQGDGAEFTKRNSAFRVVYTESLPTHLEARKRESQIKGWHQRSVETLGLSSHRDKSILSQTPQKCKFLKLASKGIILWVILIIF